MTRDELCIVLDRAADEGWNPGHDDAEAFFAADPEGFFIAAEEDMALRLMCHAASAFDGPVMIDVPSTARSSDRLCNDLSLEPGFQTARMCRGPAPAIQAELVAVTSLELGKRRPAPRAATHACMGIRLPWHTVGQVLRARREHG